MFFYAISAIINATTSLLVAVIIFVKNPKSGVNRSFSYFSASVAFWSICYFMWQVATNATSALFWCRALMAGAIFIPSSFYHFSVNLIGEQESYLKSVKFWYLFSLIFQAFNFTPLFVKDVKPQLYFSYWPTAGIVYSLFIAVFVGLTVYSHILMYKHWKKFTGFQRNQIKYVFLGTAIGFLGGSTNYPLWYGIPIPPVGNILVSVYVFLVFYSILKYRLMDINVVLTRAGIFFLVYAFVLGIPFGLVFWGRMWLGSVFGPNWFWVPMSILLVFATSGPFIYQYLRRRAEDLILKEQRRYQNILKELSFSMTLVKDLDKLVKLMVYRVARAVRVDFVAIYIFEPGQNKLIRKALRAKKDFDPGLPEEVSCDTKLIKYMQANHEPIFIEDLSPAVRKDLNLKSGLIVSSFIRENLLGFLILGPKSSGMVYTRDDAVMFEVLANQAALAIENTEFIGESQKTQAQLFAAERMTSMGAMAGGMSHQINNRFYAISLATADSIDTINLLNAEHASKEEIRKTLDQIKHALSRIEDNTRHGGKIVNDFLNFSQPERLKKERKEFDLREPLEKAIDMIKIKTSLSDDIIEMQIPEGSLQIEGNFVLLQDAFFNLLDNAIDAVDRKSKAVEDKEMAAPAGYKGKVIIQMQRFDHKISIRISDNGIGMNEAALKKAFVPFFTTKATASKGTGLGLFVIQKIISTHSGDIKVDSVFGEGTTFTITLPVK